MKRLILGAVAGIVLLIAAVAVVSYLRGETDRYPQAAFVLAAPAKIADRFTARGRLTLHGRTQPVAVKLQSRRGASGLDLVGSTPIAFADYGMEPPSVAGVASVRDHGKLEVRLVLR